MKLNITSFFLVLFLFISCAKKNGSSTPIPSATLKNSSKELLTNQDSILPKLTYTLKTQTEEFYIPRDTENLKIVVTPLFKNIERREVFKHLTRLTVLDMRWATTSQAEACEVIESRIVEFTVVKENRPLSYRELDLRVDDHRVSFSPEKNFYEDPDKSTFSVSLPESRGDFFIKLSTTNHSVPKLSTYTKEECDRIIYERPDRRLPMNLQSEPASEALWTSYKVEVFYEPMSE